MTSLNVSVLLFALAFCSFAAAEPTYELCEVSQKVEFGASRYRLGGSIESSSVVMRVSHRGAQSVVLVPGHSGAYPAAVSTAVLRPLGRCRSAWPLAMEQRVPAEVVENGGRVVRDVLEEVVDVVTTLKQGGHLHPSLGSNEGGVHLPPGTIVYELGVSSEVRSYSYVYVNGATGYMGNANLVANDISLLDPDFGLSDDQWGSSVEDYIRTSVAHNVDGQAKRDREVYTKTGASFPVQVEVTEPGVPLYGRKGKPLITLPTKTRLQVERDRDDRVWVRVRGARGFVLGVVRRDDVRFLSTSPGRQGFGSTKTIPADVKTSERGATGVRGAAGALRGATARTRPRIRVGSRVCLLADTAVLGHASWTDEREGAVPRTALFTLATPTQAKVLGLTTREPLRAYVEFHGVTGYVDLATLRRTSGSKD